MSPGKSSTISETTALKLTKFWQKSFHNIRKGFGNKTDDYDQQQSKTKSNWFKLGKKTNHSFALIDESAEKLLYEASIYEPIRNALNQSIEGLKNTEFFLDPRYEIQFEDKFKLKNIQLIAVGSFGKVFIGTETVKSAEEDTNEETNNNNKKFAIKIMSAPHISLRRLKAWEIMVQREIHYMDKLRHDDIVDLKDVLYLPSHSDEKEHWRPLMERAHVAIKMEYLNTTLADMYRNGPFNLYAIHNCALQISSALEHMHKHGVVHHDVKPYNIMATEPLTNRTDRNSMLACCHYKLIDFGMVKDYGQSNGRNVMDSSFIRNGTPFYWSKEKSANSKPYNPFKADVYALGISLLEAHLGMVKFMSMKEQAIDEQCELSDMVFKYWLDNRMKMEHVECLDIIHYMLKPESERPQMNEVNRDFRSTRSLAYSGIRRDF
ncbi:hypothetical protein RDWZM_006517 [Blomia tropicalis]|uniref:Protein kinase domain-containing protein n=1 Tax=Blomia tropicalis TaxID=40697 RepID=A0A9Q0RNN2_BLOTA|nr:hypothetical protein RDWZM_006517 [Blomia tropicalis]